MVAFLCNTIISKVLLYYFYSSGIMSDSIDHQTQSDHQHAYSKSDLKAKYTCDFTMVKMCH